MKNFYVFAIAVSICTMLGTQALASGVPYVDTVTIPAENEVSLFVLPDGTGSPLSSGMGFGGNEVDARVSVHLIDTEGYDIANFPFEDMWLSSESTTVQYCGFVGFIAEMNSDYFGELVFSMPLAGGGSSEGSIWFYLNGMRATHPQNGELPPVSIRVNSADISADGLVNLTDVTLFAGDFYGDYRYRSDFYWDGAVDLSDLVKFAQGLGHNCQ
jgi:hypothetical protein